MTKKNLKTQPFSETHFHSESGTGGVGHEGNDYKVRERFIDILPTFPFSTSLPIILHAIHLPPIFFPFVHCHHTWLIFPPSKIIVTQTL